jgi:hypothetical protein
VRLWSKEHPSVYSIYDVYDVSISFN